MAETRSPVARRRVALILLIGALVGAALGLVRWGVEVPVYTAQTVVRVGVVRGGAVAISGPLSTAYADAARSDAVLDPAIRRILSQRPVAELKAGTRVKVLDSGLVEIAVTSPGPGTGAALANSIAKQLDAAVPLEAEALARGRAIQVQPLLAATRPVSPDATPGALNVLAGALVGVLVGALVAQLLQAARRLGSRRLRSATDVARLTDVPVLATVPVITVHGAVPVNESLSTRLGLLRTGLEPWLDAAGSRVLLVTSTARGDGRTSLVAALGTAMSLEGRSVLAVDMDLQHPRLARAFGMTSRRGIADVLRGEAALQDVAEVHGSGCIVVAAGDDAEADAASGSTGAVDEAFRRFRAEVDTVLLDGPPQRGSRSPLPLARVADGALVVVVLGRTRSTELSALLDALQRSGVAVVGIALETLTGRAPARSAGAVGSRPRVAVVRSPLDPPPSMP